MNALTSPEPSFEPSAKFTDFLRFPSGGRPPPSLRPPPALGTPPPAFTPPRSLAPPPPQPGPIWIVAVACTGASLIAVAGHGGLALHEGALLVLGAAVSQAAFFVGQKPLLRRYKSLELTTWAMAIGALMTLPFAPGLPHAVATAPAEALAAVAFLGLGASAIGFVTWAYACAHIDVSLAAATLYSVPVVAFTVAWLWLGEQPTAITLIGGAIALAGVALVSRAGGRSRAASAAPSRPASPASAARPA